MRFAPAGVLTLMVALAWPFSTAWAAGGEGVDDQATTLELTYNLYAGGVPLGRVSLSARIRESGYTAASTLETVGLANAFWRAKLEGSSFGSVDGRGPHPSTYEAFSIHSETRGNRQQVTVTYDNGLPTFVASPPYTSVVPVSDEDRMGTLDPISALIFFTTSYEANRQKPCSLVAPVYDGRRRYDVTLDFVRKRDIRMDNGLYRGQVDECRLTYTAVAGARQRVFENGDPPNVFGWVASVASGNDPAKRLLMPLRIWAETDYGIVVALATKVTLDGSDLATIN